jgi:hypothetical protein
LIRFFVFDPKRELIGGEEPRRSNEKSGFVESKERDVAQIGRKLRPEKNRQ